MSNKLRELIEYSIKNVQYYRDLNLYPKCNIEDFPLLTKTTVQNNPHSLISDHELPNLNSLLVKSSSGSSGIPTSVYWSQNGYLQSMRSLWKCRIKFHDIYPTSMGLDFTNQSIDPNNWFSIKKNLISACGWIIDDYSKIEKLLYYVNHLNIEWIYIQPYIAMKLMSYIKENNITLPKSLRYVEFVGEILSNEVRNEAQRIFNVPIANMYGSEEMNGIAYECPYGTMHVLDDNVFVETLDKDEGEIIITSLTNYAMPMLRYRQGDIVVLGEKNNCSCGCNGLTIKSILGRSYEIINTHQGLINPYILTSVMEFVNRQTASQIKQYKFIWDSRAKKMYLYIKCESNIEEVRHSIKVLVRTKLLENSLPIELKDILFKKDMPREFGKYSILKIIGKEDAYV